MQQAAEAQPTAMAAVLKLENAAVEALCAQFPETYPVNYNCPGQVSVACAKEQLAPLLRRGEGRRRPGPAPEGGRGSTPPSWPLRPRALPRCWRTARWASRSFPCTPTRPGRSMTATPRSCWPSRSSPRAVGTIVRNMIAAGADTFIELGPGKTLCGLIAKTDQTVKTYALSTQADLEQIVKEVLGGC